MSEPVLSYRHAESPSRGLAVTGIFFIKVLLAVPHLVLVSALQSLALLGSYLAYWVVAFTGAYPGGPYHFVDMWMGWANRSWGWIIGFTDRYPKFELAAEYPIAVSTEAPTAPSKGWAVAGIFGLRYLVLIPHIVVLALVSLGTAVAVWFGFFAVAFTGALPVGIQDFAAGTMQWWLRVMGFATGLSDEYPRFGLTVNRPA